MHSTQTVRWLCMLVASGSAVAAQEKIQVVETDERIRITTPHLQASIKKRGYVSGVESRSLVDRRSGMRDAGFGLDIVDWIMEPGSDEAYRDQLEPELRYEFNNLFHGKIAKRSLEGPQICTRARQLDPTVTRGRDFVAVRQSFQYKTAAPGKKRGSRWSQILVFPEDTRYFISMDRIDAVNESEAMFLRIDMPGHIRHTKGDSFSEIFLSYHGRIPNSQFVENFPPDEKFHFSRARDGVPDRVIRAYKLRDTATGKAGPWLAGMTLDPAMVFEAWCHQRGYVCMIEEIGGRPIRPGESFSAAFIVGFFDSIEQMQATYDRHKGARRLVVNDDSWKLAD